MNYLTSARKAGTVVLVEPHAPSRIVLHNALAQHGYRVIQAQGGREAETAASKLTTPPQLLITELVLPDMDGLQLAERLSARCPRLRLLLVSGDCHDVLFLNPATAGWADFVRKPIEPQAVVSKVTAMLKAA